MCDECRNGCFLHTKTKQSHNFIMKWYRYFKAHKIFELAWLHAVIYTLFTLDLSVVKPMHLLFASQKTYKYTKRKYIYFRSKTCLQRIILHDVIFLSQMEYYFMSSTNLTKFNEVCSWKKIKIKKISGNEARKLNSTQFSFEFNTFILFRY